MDLLLRISRMHEQDIDILTPFSLANLRVLSSKHISISSANSNSSDYGNS